MEFKPNKIIFHHTADSYNGDQFEKVNAYHKKQGFPMSSRQYFIGYHVFIERSGTIRFPRSYDEIGAHTLGQNDESVGVCMAGNFDVELPTDAQKESLGKVCQEAMSMLKIPITEIYPHRMFRPTSCPGQKLKDKFAAYAVIEQQLNIIKKAILWLKISLGK